MTAWYQVTSTDRIVLLLYTLLLLLLLLRFAAIVVALFDRDSTLSIAGICRLRCSNYLLTVQHLEKR